MGNLESCKRSRWIWIFSVLISIPPAWTWAEQDSAHTILLRETTFAQLASIHVTVASDQPEKTADAPGTVTAYNAEDIDKFGYLTLRELAELTPGYSTRIGSDSKGNWS